MPLLPDSLEVKFHGFLNKLQYGGSVLDVDMDSHKLLIF
jgi:hypothetical protein